MGKIIESYTSCEASMDVVPVPGAGIVWQLAPPPVLPTVPRTLGLTRLEFVINSAVLTGLALVLAGTRGTPVAPGIHDGLIASTGNGGYSGGTGRGSVTTTWTVAPTVSGNFYRQSVVAGVIGDVILWEWPEDDPFTFQLDANHNGILVQNIGGGASANMLVNTRWLEFRPQ